MDFWRYTLTMQFPIISLTLLPFFLCLISSGTASEKTGPFCLVGLEGMARGAAANDLRARDDCDRPWRACSYTRGGSFKMKLKKIHFAWAQFYDALRSC